MSVDIVGRYVAGLTSPLASVSLPCGVVMLAYIKNVALRCEKS